MADRDGAHPGAGLETRTTAGLETGATKPGDRRYKSLETGATKVWTPAIHGKDRRIERCGPRLAQD
jgi:hypothetical protein